MFLLRSHKESSDSTHAGPSSLRVLRETEAERCRFAACPNPRALDANDPAMQSVSGELHDGKSPPYRWRRSGVGDKCDKHDAVERRTGDEEHPTAIFA
jgi:hypothetical protein